RRARGAARLTVRRGAAVALVGCRPPPGARRRRRRRGAGAAGVGRAAGALRGPQPASGRRRLADVHAHAPPRVRRRAAAPAGASRLARTRPRLRRGGRPLPVKPPARAIVGNLVWSTDGGVWAVWRVFPFPLAHTSVADKLAIHSRIRGLLVNLPTDSMLLSVCERVDPLEVVGKMVE